MTTKEEILKLAGEPVARTTTSKYEWISQGDGTWYGGIIESQLPLEESTNLYTADQILAVVKPLEDKIERLKLIEDNALKVCGQLDEVVLALPYDYLDPPDGGDVSLGEQVTRMYSEVKALRAKVEGEAELRQQLAASHLLIESLWAIIDDIDTYGDIAKSDDKLFRAMVERRQKDRWKTGITTDGYTLSIPTDTTALEAIVVKAGEVMRGNVICVLGPTGRRGGFCTPYEEGYRDAQDCIESNIRALPGVTLADLKGAE